MLQIPVPETAGAQARQPLTTDTIQIDLHEHIGITTNIIELAWFWRTNNVYFGSALECEFLTTAILKQDTTILPIDDTVTFTTRIAQSIGTIIERFIGDWFYPFIATNFRSWASQGIAVAFRIQTFGWVFLIITNLIPGIARWK